MQKVIGTLVQRQIMNDRSMDAVSEKPPFSQMPSMQQSIDQPSYYRAMLDEPKKRHY